MPSSSPFKGSSERRGLHHRHRHRHRTRDASPHETDTETGIETGIETDVDTDTDADVADESFAGLEADADPTSVEIRRDAPLAAVIGTAAGLLAVAFLLRAVGSGTLLDWALFALTGIVAALHLVPLLDARAPLMVLDELGVRARRGATWQAVAWSEATRVEHRPRVSMLRDGSLTVVDSQGEDVAIRLSLSTRLVGADWHELTSALEELAGDRVPVLDLGRAVPAVADQAPADAEATDLPEIEPELAHDAAVHAADAVEAEVWELDDLALEDPAPEPGRVPAPHRRSDQLIERVVAEAPARADDDTVFVAAVPADVGPPRAPSPTPPPS